MQHYHQCFRLLWVSIQVFIYADILPDVISTFACRAACHLIPYYFLLIFYVIFASVSIFNIFSIFLCVFCLLLWIFSYIFMALYMYQFLVLLRLVIIFVTIYCRTIGECASVTVPIWCFFVCSLLLNDRWVYFYYSPYLLLPINALFSLRHAGALQLITSKYVLPHP